MADELPYLVSYKNVGALFKKIESAAVPESFGHRFLTDTIGLKGSGDRGLITLLKNLGFLDPSGKPLPAYSLLKNTNLAATEIAKGVRNAYAPLFKANEKAHELTRDELKGLVAQVAGSDTTMTQKIVGTFSALKGVADFSSPPIKDLDDEGDNGSDEEGEDRKLPTPPGSMRPEFHYNLQIQLPSNGSEETYINIFNAIRKVFQ